MASMIDERFIELYTFIAEVRHKKELSQERLKELEGIADELFLEVNGFYKDSKKEK